MIKYNIGYWSIFDYWSIGYHLNNNQGEAVAEVEGQEHNSFLRHIFDLHDIDYHCSNNQDKDLG